MNIKKTMKRTICTGMAALTLMGVCGAYAQKITPVQLDDLKKFNIMTGDAETGDLRLGDNITRAEAAKMLCTAAGFDTDAAEDSFPDVPKDHWAYKYIYAAKQNGLVAGDENGNFNPYSNITNEEFVKMAVCLVGYGVFAEVNGGYPMGYVTAAARYGLTKNLQLETETAAKREDVAIIISNALDTPLMVNKGSSEDEVEWIIMDGNGENEKKTLRIRLESNNK